MSYFLITKFAEVTVLSACSYRSLKSVAVFLAEQPSQIKYIEWPTFQNTVCIPENTSR